MARKKIINELKNIKKALREKEHVLKEQKKLTKKATLATNRVVKELENETKKHVVTAIVAAFGFIIALVWRDAIKEFINTFDENFSINGPGHYHILHSNNNYNNCSNRDCYYNQMEFSTRKTNII